MKHGMSRSPEHNAWCHMNSRCYNKNHQRYMDWGGRGIKVCKRWRNSFKNFYYDMGERPSNEHSLDRVNNDKDYCPENCRWATRKEQANNQRMRRDNKSGVVGVYYDKNKERWRARHKGKNVGSSRTFEEACALRKLAEDGGYDARYKFMPKQKLSDEK